MVCKERPIACRTNATFVSDTSSLEQRDDDKADDNRSFRHHRKKIEFVELNDGDVVNLHTTWESKKESSPFLYNSFWYTNENIKKGKFFNGTVLNI